MLCLVKLGPLPRSVRSNSVRTFILAKKEKDRKVAVAKLIKDRIPCKTRAAGICRLPPLPNSLTSPLKEVRDSVQTFYDAMDKSSKSYSMISILICTHCALKQIFQRFLLVDF